MNFNNKKNSKEIMKLVILGLFVGILTGILGSVFLICVIAIQQFHDFLSGTVSDNLYFQFIFVVSFTTILTVFGVWVVRKFEPTASGSGVHEIEGVLGGERKLKWYKVIPVKFISGVASLSSGLVLGREGPMIHMGGAIGEMSKVIFKLCNEHRNILVAAGAGAGLTVAFNAPLAGILFIIEEMHYQFKYSFKSLQTVIVACISADIVLQVFLYLLNDNVRSLADITMTIYNTPAIGSLWLFALLGVLFGGFGLIFNKGLIMTANLFASRSTKQFWILVTFVGIIMGILSMLYSPVTGGGYVVMPNALSLQYTWYALMIIFVIRFFTTWMSYGTGTVGGFFSPMLALGTVFGVLFGYLANYLLPNIAPDIQVFAIAGMAALFASTVGAPLTGLVLVLELTMNFGMVLPLIITCLFATLSGMYFGERPIYASLLQRVIVLERKKKLYLKMK